MAHITPASEMLRDSDLLRAAPVQARSNARLTALLDAAAALIHKNGYEELTTAAVAGQAGASIGTVYRYFDDRVKLLWALSTRNFERTSFAIADALTSSASGTVTDGVNALFEAYLGLFRNETGYRSLRMGDVLDIRPRATELASRRVSETIATAFASNYGTPASDDTIQKLESGFVVVDALLARAFATSDKGDAVFVDAARRAAAAIAKDLS